MSDKNSLSGDEAALNEEEKSLSQGNQDEDNIKDESEAQANYEYKEVSEMSEVT